MFDQFFESFRKASESSLQAQQDLLKSWQLQWPPSAFGSAAATDWTDVQKRWLEGRGVDTAALSDTAILSANTGSQVFLRANLRFADAMEDLTFEISM